MGSRPAAYESFKENQYGITVDFRVYANADTPLEVVLNEAMISYTRLIDRIGERWGTRDERKSNNGQSLAGLQGSAGTSTD